MKALREWLHWATNETHVPAIERAERSADLSDAEGDLVGDAASQIKWHAKRDEYSCGTEEVAWCLEHHPQAFHDLCLEFARAIEKMRDLVPEAPSTPEPEDECEDSYEPGTIPWFRYAPMHTGRREGMSSVFAQTLAEAAQVVDEVRAARERRLSEMRRLFTEGRVVVGVDWGVSNATNHVTILNPGERCLCAACTG